MRGAAVVFVMVSVVAVAAVACGSGSGRTATPSARTPAVTATGAASASPATAIAAASATSPAASATGTPAAMAATATPPASGETGIAGTATVGPTCPVERADSPCPDRPYEARITVWQGSTMVSETRSGADGRFTVLLPPGTYRVVGESGSTFPHGTETTATVVEGQLTQVTLRFDSGIR